MIALVESEPANAQDWYAHVLDQALEQRRPLRTLVLSGRPEELAAVGVAAPISVRTGQGARATWHALNCRVSGLPFQEDAFDLVVLHEWVDQDDERALAAVRRAMPGGSQLLVLGRGRFSADRWRKVGRGGRSWRPGWLCRRMGVLGFAPRDLRGRGVAGIDMVTGRGWRRGLLACTDRIAIRARRSDGRPDIRLVRFSTPKAAMGGTTAWDGARRESTS